MNWILNLYRVPQKKCHPICVQSSTLVYSQIQQGIYIDVLAIGLVVICTKDGWYNFINKKLKQFSWVMIFVAEDMNINRNLRNSNSELKSHNFDDQYRTKYNIYSSNFFCEVSYISWLLKNIIGFNIAYILWK